MFVSSCRKQSTTPVGYQIDHAEKQIGIGDRVMLNTIATSLSRYAGRLPGAALSCRLARNQNGSAAVEFAMVAAPFLAIIFAILQIALVFFATQTLETAVAESGRLILTGQAQNQKFTAADFKKSVCDMILGLFDCTNGVYVDVKSYNSFSQASSSPPVTYDSKGNIVDNFSYQPGGPSTITVVRLLYQWPIYVPLLGVDLSSQGSSGRLTIVATAAFQTEPFQ